MHFEQTAGSDAVSTLSGLFNAVGDRQVAISF